MLLRSKSLSTTSLFELLAAPSRLFALSIGEGAPGPSGGSSGGGSSPASGGSPASSSPSGGATSTVAPGVEPPPGSPGSMVPASTTSDGGPDGPPDFMSIFEGPQDPPPVFPGSEPATTPPVAPAVTPPAAAPAAPAAPPAPAAATPPQAPGPGDGGQPPAATPPASGTSPALDPYDPVQLANHIQQNEAQMVEFVAQSLFALTPEDLQALETDVAGTVPKLLAKGFVRSQQNLLMQISRLVPEMIKRTTGDLQNYKSNEDAFYSKWPQLNREAHGQLVTRLGIMFRQANPKITRDQMIEELGPLVMMTAKVPFTPTAAPAASAPLGTPPPRPQHQPSPFAPAIPGPAAQVQQAELSPVEAMFAPQE